MNNEIKGVAFPFRVGGRGGILMSGNSVSEQQHIKENILSGLGTREGERVMKPYLGMEDLDIFFNDLNETTKNMVIFKIREKMIEMEPRVEITDVQIYEEDTGGGIAYIINLMYVELDSDRVNSTTFTI
jgi:phage baseplate assembly protein W